MKKIFSILLLSLCFAGIANAASTWLLESAVSYNAQDACIQRVEYSYDDNGQMQSYIVYTWDATKNAFVKANKLIYSYNNLGEQTGYTYYSWNASTSQWTYVSTYETPDPATSLSKSEEIYDNGVLVGYIYYYRPNVSSAWVLQSKVEYAYEGDDIIYTTYLWNAQTSNWVFSNQSKSAQEFDTNGNVSVARSYYRTSIDAAWTYNGKVMYSYTLFSNKEGIDKIEGTNTNTRKIFRDGQVLIQMDGKTFNLNGTEIR